MCFGEILDVLIDWLVRYGNAEEEEETGALYASNMNVTVSTPGYQGSLFIDAHDTLWRLEYEWKSTEQTAHEGNRNRMQTRWNASRGPYMSSVRSIQEDCLQAIADCLRGFEFPEDLVEVQPPYEAITGDNHSPMTGGASAKQSRTPRRPRA
jgi:hypothetical protein